MCDMAGSTEPTGSFGDIHKIVGCRIEVVVVKIEHAACIIGCTKGVPKVGWEDKVGARSMVQCVVGVGDRDYDMLVTDRAIPARRSQ